jgi:hypothetical protein
MTAWTILPYQAGWYRQSGRPQQGHIFPASAQPPEVADPGALKLTAAIVAEAKREIIVVE